MPTWYNDVDKVDQGQSKIQEKKSSSCCARAATAQKSREVMEEERERRRGKRVRREPTSRRIPNPRQCGGKRDGEHCSSNLGVKPPPKRWLLWVG